MENKAFLRPGTLLKNGNYRIEALLGCGGFGLTYRAYHFGLERQVAIKEFFVDDYCDRNMMTSQVEFSSSSDTSVPIRLKSKFIKEAKMVAQLKCHNIVEIYDVFEDNNTAYYVMEYISGVNLYEYVNKNGPMDTAMAKSVIMQLSEALEYIHEKKILHLDIKPANIMFRENGEVVLIDFGISKRYDDNGSLTTSAILGRSRGYAPLEQYESTALTQFSPATDIYSLGATLYFLLTGVVPPESDIVLNDGVPDMVGADAGMTRAVKAAMQPTVKSRPQNIKEFLSVMNGTGQVKEKSGRGFGYWFLILLLVVGVNAGAIYAAMEYFHIVNDAETGKALFLDGKYDESYRYLKAASSAGDAECTYYLGQCYFLGEGVAADHKEALKLFSRAAKKNIAEAQYVLYLMYLDGIAVEPDAVKANMWLKKAAEGGLEEAMINLGDYYIQEEEYTKGYEWYVKADSQGIPAAKYKLGRCYYMGYGVEENNYIAIDLFRDAYRLGVPEGAYMVGECYFYGYGVEENDTIAVSWYKKSAALGYNVAMRDLGYCYSNGYGVSENIPVALEWYKKAADNGDVLSQWRLGEWYHNGINVAEDYVEAFKWYTMAAESGNSDAMNIIARYYDEGWGDIEENNREAFNWYKKAADAGSTEAYYNLGICYYNGEGVLRDYEQAELMMREAESRGHSSAADFIEEHF